MTGGIPADILDMAGTTPEERTAARIQIANRALLIYVARFRKECEDALAAQEAAARKDAA